MHAGMYERVLMLARGSVLANILIITRGGTHGNTRMNNNLLQLALITIPVCNNVDFAVDCPATADVGGGHSVFHNHTNQQ